MTIPSVPPSAPVPPRETIGARLRRAQASAPGYPPTLMASPPSLTLGTPSAGAPGSAYAGAKQIATGVQILPSDPRFLIGGGQLSPYGNGYQVFNAYESTYYNQFHSFTELVFDGSFDGKIEFCVGCNTSKIDFYVNDQLVQAEGSYNNAPSGNFVTHLLNFGAGVSGARIRMESQGANLFGIGTDPRNAISRVSAANRINAVFYGDSWTGPSTAASTPLVGMTPIAAKALGWRNDCHIGAGGTGLLNPSAAQNKHTWINRAPFDLWPLLPTCDVLVIFGSTNDGSYGAAVGPAATAFLQAVRAQGFRRPIIWLGIQGSTASYPTATEAALAAAVQAFAAADGATWFIDPYGWLTGTGSNGNPKVDGNEDFYNDTSTGHPTDAGHRYFGLRMAREIANVINGLS